MNTLQGPDIIALVIYFAILIWIGIRVARAER
jgi:hypothetical protein